MKRIILIDDQYQNLFEFMREGLNLAFDGKILFEAVPFRSYYLIASVIEYDQELEKYLSIIPEDERKDCCFLLDWVFMHTVQGVNKGEWHGSGLFDLLGKKGFRNVIIFSNYTDDEDFRNALVQNGLCLAKPSQDILNSYQQDPSSIAVREDSLEYFRRLRLLVQSLFFDEQLERYGMLLGSVPEMRDVAELIERAASSEVNVLIVGDTGTGKELTAKAIHALSTRKSQRFLAINCSGIPPDLLETELFGYAPGTFTDQLREGKLGLLREVNGGTILLDEIGDMPLMMQSKLLRFLQDRKVRPVGGASEIEVDVRILCSTNRNLRALIDENEKTRGEKGFRSDLFWRIRVLEINLPPLAERLRKDTELLYLLFYHFLRKAFRMNRPSRIGDLFLSKDAEQLLIDYGWPGNFREFENVILGATALLPENENRISENLLLRLIEKSESESQIGAYVNLLHKGAVIDDVPRNLQRDTLISYVRGVFARGMRVQAEDLIGIILGEDKSKDASFRKKQCARVIQYLNRRNLTLTNLRKESLHVA
ncbi:MAG: sigma 54-interacting transcriptional regulator [Planctomycetes bacterium]|nr:sigma 54-interacting transcriptional regulator [Planctomycetota bacterium]